MISTVALALFAILVFGCNATDYCNVDLCPNGGKHIGCNHNNRFSERCESPHLLDFDDHLTEMVLGKHNKYRNDVASGAANFSSAVRMRVLTWNKELAKLAEYNVRQCLIKHDDCLNTDEFPVCGQNVGSTAIQTSNFVTADIHAMVNRIQDNWFAESMVTQQAWLDKYTTTTYGNVIFHFTTMIQDHATEIGCGAIKYSIPLAEMPHTVLLLTCNYSFTNIINRRVYVSGAAASKCKTGPDVIFTSLCSPAEFISTDFKQYGIIKSKKKDKCKSRKYLPTIKYIYK